MTAVAQRILGKVDDCVTRYRLIPSGERVLVALSGGKDSLVLCLLLRELGTAFTPVVVDMGYEAGWGTRIASIARTYGLEAEVVDVHDRAGVAAARGIRLRLEVLERNPADSSERYTPCTYCHGVKIEALRRMATRAGTGIVALGQHRTDAVVSLIKEGLMHIDHRRHPGRPFARSRYGRLVAEFAREAATFGAADTPVIDEIDGLVRTRRVDTDEPPREPLAADPDTDVIRPMFDVLESEIEQMRDDRSLVTEGSGCHHGLSAQTYTPREMVHYGVLRDLANPAFDAWADRAVLAGIDAEGRGVVRSRARRGELLGPGYKPVENGLDKMA